MDYYSFDRTIRSSAAASAVSKGSALGTYDPLAFRIHLATTAPIDIDEIHADIHNHPTYFHELIHSWQLYAHPLCALMACINSLEAAMVVAMLPNGYRIKKPLIDDNADSTHEHDGHIFQAKRGQPSDEYAQYVNEHFFMFERLNSAIDDPIKASEKVARMVEGVRATVGMDADHAVSPDLERGFLTYMAMFFEEVRTQLKPHQWPGSIDVFPLIAKLQQTWPPPSQDISRFQLGLEHIQEGQARFLELQLGALHDPSKRSLQAAQAGGNLPSLYRRAFVKFVELSEVGTPDSLLDWRVHAFNVVCDFAMSGTTGYSGFFPAPEHLMDYVHPGARFVRACKVIANSDLAEKFSALYPSDVTDPNELMLDTFAFIEEYAVLPGEPPLREALEQVARFADEMLSEQSKGSLFSRKKAINYPKIIPLFNFLYRHFMVCESRLRNKGFYSNPLVLAIHAPAALSIALPWAITSDDDLRIIDLHRNGWTSDKGAPEGGREYPYFIGHIYSDMVRQLLTKSGPFEYHYPWMGEHGQMIGQMGAKAIFQQYFGVDPDQVH